MSRKHETVAATNRAAERAAAAAPVETVETITDNVRSYLYAAYKYETGDAARQIAKFREAVASGGLTDAVRYYAAEAMRAERRLVLWTELFAALKLTDAAAPDLHALRDGCETFRAGLLRNILDAATTANGASGTRSATNVRAAASDAALETDVDFERTLRAFISLIDREIVRAAEIVGA